MIFEKYLHELIIKYLMSSELIIEEKIKRELEKYLITII